MLSTVVRLNSTTLGTRSDVNLFDIVRPQLKILGKNLNDEGTVKKKFFFLFFFNIQHCLTFPVFIFNIYMIVFFFSKIYLLLILK